MYRYNKKATSLIFGICLILGIVLFGVFGATFAYFQIDNYVEKTYVLGRVGAYWCQNETQVTSGNTITLNSESSLVRGDVAGVDITGGMLSVKAIAESEREYVRIRYRAFVDGVEVSAITDNLVLRIKDGNNYEALNSNDSPWKLAGGWYYYSVEAIDGNSDSISVCNNVMLVELDQAYLSKTLEIKLEFETLQADNDPVEAVWGSEAKEALGL